MRLPLPPALRAAHAISKTERPELACTRSAATTRWSDEARKNEYPVLLQPDGPYYFAGEYLSYVNGWQEGAVRSAHFALERLATAAISHPRNKEKV